MNIIYIDPVGGLSGDMLCAALLDLGLDSQQWLDELKRLGLTNWKATIWRESRGAFMATRLLFAPQKQYVKHADSNLENWDSHHRHYSDIVKLIDNAELPTTVKANALSVFKCLGEAEAQIHGVTLIDVHFHEVGAVDSILDIVGFCIGLHQLGIESICNGPLPMANGTIKGAHGTIPLPAPATLALLKGRAVCSGMPDQEQVTPTGAAIVSALSRDSTFPECTISEIGYGAGTRNPTEYPNITRVVLGNIEAPDPSQSIVEMKTQIDDMTGEELPRLIELLLKAGAIDAYFQSISMKKGRPGHLLTILSRTSDREQISQVLFEHSSTFGLRWQHLNRTVLERRWEAVDTQWGSVRIKIGTRNGKIMTRSPEYDDVAKCANDHGVSLKRVMDSAISAAQEMI